MKAVVIGASGATGKALIARLLNNEAYTQVVAILRKQSLEQHPKLQQVIVNFSDMENVSDSIKGDVAFSCLGTTLKAAGSKEGQWKVDYEYQLKFAEIARRNNIPVFCLVSAKGASANSRFFYYKMKGRLDEAIRTLQFQKTVIFRPGVLVRPESDRRFEKVFVKIADFFNRLGLLKSLKSTQVDTLAAALINSQHVVQDKYTILEVNEIHKITKT
ncbi:NAD(P)H-binding protein [Polluticaenibacter yanchengensis]|uniref:NAD(P)H-binding protein n=1 Tax=Polluticaenibacter yanchengensis TaxID=3014562 RepID=A0ABT4UJM7_9BACT|nr:NAD(P)H-binding protein [Chitinophagaceae bacterium LY-5]